MEVSQMESSIVKNAAKDLLKERDNLDLHIASLQEKLTENNATMESSLVDAEGFPRNDIDVATIRALRHDIICKVNDRKSVTKQLEEALTQLHSSYRVQEGSTGAAVGSDSTQYTHRRTSNEPFLLVQGVIAGSPAADAGLKDADVVIQFGSLCKTNYAALSQLADIVNNSIEKRVPVTVVRNDKAVHLTLTPKKWSGKGLLGCTVTPKT